MDKIGIIIPAYQAANTLCDVIQQCRHVPDIAGVIVVNDGSTDGTESIAQQEQVIVVTHELNRGKGAALVSGFDEASRHGWDAVLTIDADGQHDPQFALAFIQCWRETNAHVIIGVREREGSPMPVQRRLSNAMSSAVVSRLAHSRITDSQSGYRLIARPVWETLQFSTTRYDMESELLIKAGRAGFTIAEVPISTVYASEQSHFHAFRDTFRMASVFIKLWREADGA